MENASTSVPLNISVVVSTDEEDDNEALANVQQQQLGDDDDPNEDYSENEESADDVLNMPVRKMKDPSPVWKCAEKVMDGSGTG